MVKIRYLLNILTYGVAITGVGPLYIWLESPAQLFLPVALVTGIYSDYKERYFLSSTLATVVSACFFFLYVLQFNLSNVVPPVVNLVALLLAVRLMTEKSYRNFLQLYMLSLFALASSSVFSLNVFYFPALVLLVFGITIGLVLLTFYTKEPTMRLSRFHFISLLKTAVILPVASLLLMLFFFAILPRTEHPLWRLMQPDTAASSSAGFSEEVTPGTYSSLSSSNNLAFRAQCSELPENMLYWRGTVLNHIEGTVWSRGQQVQETSSSSGGTFVDCVYYYPPKTTRFLFTLDFPTTISGIRHIRSDDYVFEAHKPIQNNIRFTARSHTGSHITLQRKDIDSSRYLQLPDNITDRILRAAGAINKQGQTAEEKIQLLQQFFQNQELTYANNDLPGPELPIDSFLFEKKRGYCEFFASSFALLSRMLGVPSRLVGGYFGGNYNEIGGYYHITEDMAHVWVEVLIGGKWQRIDPTSFAYNYTENSFHKDLSLFRKSLDSIEYFWVQTVISYDFQKQLRLAGNTRAKFRSFQIDWKGIQKQTWYILLLTTLGFVVVWHYIRRRQQTPEEKILKRYFAALNEISHGQSIPDNIGLFELADTLQNALCKEFATIIGPCLYSSEPLDRKRYQQLEGIIRQLLKKS